MGAKQIIRPKTLHSINLAIGRAASVTSANIVPIVARRSGWYDRAEELVGLYSAAIALSLLLAFYLRAAAPSAEPIELADRFGLLQVLGIIVSGFTIGALIASRLQWLRRLFVPRGQFRANVQARAQQTFNQMRLDSRPTMELAPGRGNDDAARTLLIYVSLYEKQACVLAGESIRAAITPDQIDALRQGIEESLKARRLGKGLRQAIASAAKLLGPHFPPEAARQNAEPSLCLSVVD